MSASESVGIIITIKESALPEIDQISSRLRTAGVAVKDVLRTSGIISGQVPAHQIDMLKQLPGVLDVELDGEMHAI